MSGASSPEARTDPGVAPPEFRRLLSRFATGVTVAAALDQNGLPQGMTASAVSSVSLNPPLLLVCVDHAADSFRTLSGARWFSLSVLASDQEALSRRFASEITNRFDGVPHRAGPHGLPLLEGAVAHIICERWSAQAVGDHTVFFGRVIGGETFDRPPLLHFRGEYGTLRADGRTDGPAGPGQ